nr:probable envelope ADP,ATP carrier protein, chloroplastic [Tanacetum cinerariifolium]
MRWEGGRLRKYGHVFSFPDVNTGPAINNYNVIASQEPSEENEEDEALSRPMKKKKMEHVTNDDFCLDEKEENNDDLKIKQVITGSINHLNNEFRSSTLSLELLGNSFMYLKNWLPDVYKFCLRSSTSTQAKHPEPLLRFLYSWERLPPHAALERILDDVVFAAGALSGAAAKTVTRSSSECLDNIVKYAKCRVNKHLRTHGLRVGQESAKKEIGFVQAFVSVGKQEGLKGYWNGSTCPSLLRCHHAYKVTYPLDVLILRLAVDPGYQTMTYVCLKMLKEEGLGSHC